MRINNLIAYLKILFVVICLSLSFSKSVQAIPITISADSHTQPSPLLEFLKKILEEDPSPFTNDLVSKALEDILKSFSFLSGFGSADADAADAEQKLKEEIAEDSKKIEDELDTAIEKMIDDSIKEALKEDPDITDDIEVDVSIELSIIDPSGILSRISAGAFPKVSSLVKPIKLNNNNTINNINFSIMDPVTLFDSNDVGIFSLNKSDIRLFKVPSPSTFLLVLLVLFGYSITRIRALNN